MHDRHRPGEPGEERRLLHRGVAAADDDDVLVAEEEAVTGRTGGHAAADQPLLVGQAQVAGRRAGGQHDRPGAVGDAVATTVLIGAGQVDGLDVLGAQVGAEPLGLLRICAISSGPMMPSGKPGKFSTSVVVISAPPDWSPRTPAA